MSLLPPELLASVESGELELDFDNLDEITLRKIDTWMRQMNPDVPVPESPQVGQLCLSLSHGHKLAHLVSKVCTGSTVFYKATQLLESQLCWCVDSNMGSHNSWVYTPC